MQVPNVDSLELGLPSKNLNKMVNVVFVVFEPVPIVEAIEEDQI